MVLKCKLVVPWAGYKSVLEGLEKSHISHLPMEHTHTHISLSEELSAKVMDGVPYLWG